MRRSAPWGYTSTDAERSVVDALKEVLRGYQALHLGKLEHDILNIG